MIFITVGSQIPFDRLVSIVDSWAATNPDKQCFAQVGIGGYRPRHMNWVELMSPPEFRNILSKSNLVVSHAGMGTIITSLHFGKRVIVMPRLGSLHETRNDHQVATAKRYESLGYVEYATDADALLKMLSYLHPIKPKKLINSFASESLINFLRNFIIHTK